MATPSPHLASLTSTPAMIQAPFTGQLLIINLDPGNIAYIAYDVSGDITSAVPVEPLGNAVLSASSQVYGFTLAATPVTVSLIPGGTSKSKTAQPNADIPKAINIVLNKTIPAGGTFTSLRLPVTNFQSWFGTLFFTATSSGLGTTPYGKFELQWSVASDGYDTLRTEDWVIPNTPYQFTYNYREDVGGICIGDTLTIVASNYDSQPVNVTWGIFGSFRPRARSQMRGRYQFSGGVINEAAGLGSDDILYNTTGLNLNAGAASAAALINLAEGPAQVWGSFPGESAVGAVQVQIAPQPGPALGSPAALLGSRSVAGILDPVTFVMPRRVCTIVMKNNGTAAITNGYLTIISQAQPE